MSALSVQLHQTWIRLAKGIIHAWDLWLRSRGVSDRTLVFEAKDFIAAWEKWLQGELRRTT